MNYLFKFLSGDFLHHPKLQKWYPYLLLLLLLAVISIVNEKIILYKNKTIKDKQHEYEMALEQLKENNYFLPYYEKKIIRDKATKRGFGEHQGDMYKIAVSGKRYAVSGERYAVSGERYAVSGERYAVSGKRYAVSGERYAVSGER